MEVVTGRIFETLIDGEAVGHGFVKRRIDRANALACAFCRTTAAQVWRSKIPGRWVWCMRQGDVGFSDSKIGALVDARRELRSVECAGCKP
jgi:hypothetical protein